MSFATPAAQAQHAAAHSPSSRSQTWRAATPAELQELLPARATVEKEHIETEIRTASGITDGRGHFVAGVVLITAGYSADGKYSHFLTVGHTITFGTGSAAARLAPGEYVIGWQRVGETLVVRFYVAGTGAPVAEVPATHLGTGTRVESFRLWPQGSGPQSSLLQIGRFAIPFQLEN